MRNKADEYGAEALACDKRATKTHNRDDRQRLTMAAHVWRVIAEYAEQSSGESLRASQGCRTP
jgi:hypothetical protein